MIKRSLIFILLSFNVYFVNAQIDSSKLAEAVKAAYQNVAKETAKEMRDTFIGTETSLSYKYQVYIAICLGVLTIVVIIVGFIQWKSADRQHQLFRDSVTSIKDEANSVKERAKESFNLSQEILSISKNLINQEISELNQLREAKGKIEEQVATLQKKNEDYKPAGVIEKEVMEWIENNYMKPGAIEEKFKYIKEKNESLQNQINELKNNKS